MLFWYRRPCHIYVNNYIWTRRGYQLNIDIQDRLLDLPDLKLGTSCPFVLLRTFGKDSTVTYTQEKDVLRYPRAQKWKDDARKALRKQVLAVSKSSEW